MEKKQWKLVNAENVEAYVCDETYSSKMLTGDEMAGMPAANTMRRRSTTWWTAEIPPTWCWTTNT